MIGETPGIPVHLRWDAKHLEQFDLGGLLAPAKTERAAIARRGMVATIHLEAAGECRPLYYSRRRAHYAETGDRYSRALYSFGNVVDCVDDMAAAGLVESRKAPPGIDTPFRSEFEPLPEFLEHIASVAPDLSGLSVHEVIERRHNGVPVDYSDTERSRQERWKLRAFNEALAAADLDVRLMGGEWRGPLYREPAGKGWYWVNTARRTLVRIYSDRRLNLGGRFYGPWWQNLKKGYRPFIRIAGQFTAEPDYSQIHPTILYRMVGKAKDGDAYDLGSRVEREHGKKAVNILINAKTRHEAIGAIAGQLGCTWGQACKIYSSAKQRHAPIAKFFGSGAGIHCQYIDSLMAERVMQDALSAGRIILPIHDSFMCRKSDESHVRESMDRAMESVLRGAFQ